MENKILIVSFECVPDASYTATKVLMLTDCLTRLCNVDVLTLKYEGLAHLEKWLDARIYRVPVENMKFKERINAFRRALSRQLEGGMYDVVHFMDPFGGVVACKMKEEYGFSTIFDIYSLASWDLKFSGISSTLYKQIKEEEKVCLEMADRILVPSNTMMQYFVGKGFGDKVRFLPGVVRLRKGLQKIKEDTFNILYMGSFAGWEDIDTFLSAIKEIKKVKSIQVNVVGFAGVERLGSIVSRIQKMGIDDVFRFEGPRYGSELEEIFRRMNAGVIPLDNNNRNVLGGIIPLKLLDMMSASIPLVVTDLPAIEAAFNNGEEILLYEPGNADMLYTHLLALCEHPELGDLLANNAYKKVREVYSSQPWRRRMLAYYSELLDVDVKNISVAGEWEESETREMIVKELQRVVSRQREVTTSTTGRKIKKKKGAFSYTSTRTKRRRIDSSSEDTLKIKR